MSRKAVAVFVVLAATAAAFGGPVTDSAVASRAALGVGTTLQPLDMSGLAYLNGSLTTINSYSQTFVGASNNFSGRLTVEVFGNAATPGSSLSDLLMIYTFVGDGNPITRANGAETFTFGVDTSVQVDYAALTGSTHGRIDAETSVQVGQVTPEITLNDLIGQNDTFKFDFGPGSTSGRVAELGGNTAGNPGATETFTWYVRSSGNVQLNFVKCRVTDFGSVDVDSLALVFNPGQPNLGVPTPGAAALLGLAGLAGLRRRR